TPRRIEKITGLLARSSQEVRIEDIRAINVTCRGLIGILGIGTVDFFTTGDTAEVSFHQIWAAQKVKTLVRRLQDVS
ncbi:MAG: PH domain-containing protein, partial [Verrucomicrobiaceae bacterium]|nr:PH domain-containing protein [Verrucomicrobiaceae bacterium]